jgi:hypothetical protein
MLRRNSKSKSGGRDVRTWKGLWTCAQRPSWSVEVVLLILIILFVWGTAETSVVQIEDRGAYSAYKDYLFLPNPIPHALWEASYYADYQPKPYNDTKDLDVVVPDKGAVKLWLVGKGSPPLEDQELRYGMSARTQIKTVVGEWLEFEIESPTADGGDSWWVEVDGESKLVAYVVRRSHIKYNFAFFLSEPGRYTMDVRLDFIKFNGGSRCDPGTEGGTVGGTALDESVKSFTTFFQIPIVAKGDASVCLDGVGGGSTRPTAGNGSEEVKENQWLTDMAGGMRVLKPGSWAKRKGELAEALNHTRNYRPFHDACNPALGSMLEAQHTPRVFWIHLMGDTLTAHIFAQLRYTLGRVFEVEEARNTDARGDWARVARAKLPEAYGIFMEGPFCYYSKHRNNKILPDEQRVMFCVSYHITKVFSNAHTHKAPFVIRALAPTEYAQTVGPDLIVFNVGMEYADTYHGPNSHRGWEYRRDVNMFLDVMDEMKLQDRLVMRMSSSTHFHEADIDPAWRCRYMAALRDLNQFLYRLAVRYEGSDDMAILDSEAISAGRRDIGNKGLLYRGHDQTLTTNPVNHVQAGILLEELVRRPAPTTHIRVSCLAYMCVPAFKDAPPGAYNEDEGLLVPNQQPKLDLKPDPTLEPEPEAGVVVDEPEQPTGGRGGHQSLKKKPAS